MEKTIIVCVWCGEDFSSWLTGAKFCSGKCRTAASRATKRANRVPGERLKRCKWCYGSFAPKSTKGLFCSAKCKQAHFRASKALQKSVKDTRHQTPEVIAARALLDQLKAAMEQQDTEDSQF